MLKIKLDRIGKKGQPQYHVVVVEDKTNSGTRPVEKIGYYNPLSPTKEFRLEADKYNAWIVKGAQPTQTVRSLYLKSTKPAKPVAASKVAKPKKASNTAKSSK